MEIRQLRSLLVLVDTGFSVSRAAEHLHLVQSAISSNLDTLKKNWVCVFSNGRADD